MNFVFIVVNSLSSSDSILLRYLSMVLLIYLNSNRIESTFFSIYSIPFIDWGFVWDGGDFYSASGFLVFNYFCNT